MSAEKDTGSGQVPSFCDWMSQLPGELHNIPLCSLAIPGSHDSMSYDLDINSSIIEPDNLKGLSKIYLARRIVRKWAVTQEEPITKQLDAGVRYFDLRIARKPNDPDPTRLYFYHGLCTRTDVETVLRMIHDWSEQHPKEILILALSHFKGFKEQKVEQLHIHLISFIKTLFGAKLLHRAWNIPTLKSCWDQGRNVIVSYDYSANQHPEMWGRIPYYYGDSMDPAEVESKLCQGLEQGRSSAGDGSPLLHPQPARYLSPSVSMSMASGGEGPSSTPHRHTNRLAKEKSPYLLQHAHNPVDWYPWGQDAFDKARNEDKPIFLSVGYSTCHWCHVMERESFEDEEIGRMLSDNFVCIKLDREERPDVDKVYMTFVQATSGGGGWPMSVWLTPDLKPFIGGTYFPPRDHGRRPGFKTVLSRIMEQWLNNRPALESSGERILEALKKGTAVAANPGESPPLAPDAANRGFQQLAHSYEEEYGGFRDAPKFPKPVNLMFLMSYWSVNRSTSEGIEALQMALHTLRMMALGGIHDHVAQGFHRYSTDSSWHVPHFEKMLYDQAQLAVAYITASQVSGEQLFADVAQDILLYVSRDLSDKSGGFYSAEDADSVPSSGGTKKREGAFCVWTASEVRELLPDMVEGASEPVTQADIFMHHYGVKEQGNVAAEQDPHGELEGQNVLIVRYSVELTSARFGISVEKVNELLAAARAKMAEVRTSRPRPHLDTKMLASWNGLMLSAYARVGAVLGDKALLERALQAGYFLKDHLWDAERQTILRTCYRGDEMEVQQISPPISGFLDDYAFIICGLLDLYEATLKTEWLQWAEELQLRQDTLFWDEVGGGFFCSDPSDSTVLLQLKEDQDGAEPSANSVSASNLLRLSHYTGRQEWLQRSQQLLTAFSDRLTRVPIALPEMVRSLMAQHYTLKQIVICGQRDAPDTTSLLAAVNSLFLPHKVLMLVDDDENFLCQRLPVLSSMAQQGGVATAYVCQDFTCSLPVTDPQELRRLLLDGATDTQAE